MLLVYGSIVIMRILYHSPCEISNAAGEIFPSAGLCEIRPAAPAPEAKIVNADFSAGGCKWLCVVLYYDMTDGGEVEIWQP